MRSRRRPARARAAAIAGVLVLGVSCAHGGGSGVAPGPTVKLGLRSGPGLAVDGTVGGASAAVSLALEEPRSLVSSACPGAASPTGVEVRIPALQGGWETLPEVPLAGVVLGGRTLPAFRAAVVKDTACTLRLGLDVLGQSVLDVDLDRATVSLSRTAPELPASLEQVQVELTRAPDTDRLLAAASLSGTSATVLQTLVLATSRTTELARFQARLLGAESVLRAVQLAPGWEACDVAVRIRTDWTRSPAIGALGLEGWGARRVVVDLVNARMTLVRPKDAPPPSCRQLEDVTPVAPASREREPR